MKILINTPCLKLLGGVANHYLGLKNFWTEDVSYNTVGRRSRRRFSGWLWWPYDVVKFVLKLIWMKPDVIVLNPSLGKIALKRDLMFLQIAYFLRRKVVVFFHGFNMQEGEKMNHVAFCEQLNRCAGIFVLAEEFKSALRNWGVTVPIELTTTKVDDDLLRGVKVSARNNIRNVLFLARITREKGIFIALSAFLKLQNRFPELHLYVVGDGPALGEAKAKCDRDVIHHVHFLGRLSGRNLAKVYEQSDLYLFPTSHAEGMPTSVLEAMAFGLPVVTRPVGGLKDFFENGKMGFLVESLNSEDFAESMDRLCSDTQLMLEISEYNYDYAKNHFMASQVAMSMESLLRTFAS